MRRCYVGRLSLQQVDFNLPVAYLESSYNPLDRMRNILSHRGFTWLQIASRHASGRRLPRKRLTKPIPKSSPSLQRNWNAPSQCATKSCATEKSEPLNAANLGIGHGEAHCYTCDCSSACFHARSQARSV